MARGVVRRIISSSLVLALAHCAFLIQGCAPIAFVTKPSKDTVGPTREGGNGSANAGGEWYEGVMYVERSPEFCPGQNNSARTAISFLAASNQFWLLRRNCQEIKPTLLKDGEAVFLNGNQTSLSYQGAVLNVETQLVQTFTNPGSAIWKKPSFGNSALIECWGAGGGGGGAGQQNGFNGGGGGGGGYSKIVVSMFFLQDTEPVEIGAGGVGPGGNVREHGGDGGNSSFAIGLLIAWGGYGGKRAGVQGAIDFVSPLQGTGGGGNFALGSAGVAGASGVEGGPTAGFGGAGAGPGAGGGGPGGIGVGASGSNGLGVGAGGGGSNGSASGSGKAGNGGNGKCKVTVN